MVEEALGLVSVLFGVVGVSAVCIAVTRSGSDGRLPRDVAVGIRTRHTTASEAAWRAGHTAALPQVAATAWVAAATVVLAVLAQLSLGGGWGVVAGLGGMACEVIVLVRATMTADRAARSAS
ncbi:SdpI family protein [Nocardiopsis sp. NPDC101807]|uniref:SdpI family protein n=1 Tax=Nocardiopsis sp. NPDC101807 TaxID=3364339 RepID=UPI003817D70F